MTETLRGVDLVIPTDATILALVGENDFVYPLYGPWLERRVHTVSGRELGRDRWTNALRLADERGADWIIDNSGAEVEDAPGWELVYRFPDNGDAAQASRSMSAIACSGPGRAANSSRILSAAAR